ncbi:hypothetical protein AC578_10204 [Pseudocercospora eumusae]|uniref:Uncharacterized protein n=1 Tax=Pseudocercospora eumusae TaxID=321146 RepID=A0A139HZ95_9PEZI|nr:hypothetical protein AC578_10204 [Pseudocercospora eumusae]
MEAIAWLDSALSRRLERLISRASLSLAVCDTMLLTLAALESTLSQQVFESKETLRFRRKATRAQGRNGDDWRSSTYVVEMAFSS